MIFFFFFFFLMIRRPPRSTPLYSSAASDVYKRQEDDQAWRGIDVGSPFDHRTHGILYVAHRLPPPGREPATEAQLDEIAELVRAAGGATLGLFSSRRAAMT